MRRKKEKRYWWLIDMIQQNDYKIGAEIGCMVGNTTYRLLKHCPDLRLYAVDLWKNRQDIFTVDSREVYDQWDFSQIKKVFDRQTAPYVDRLHVMRGISWDMAMYVQEEELDFVFIDADHGYESVLKDIKAWTPKLKPGGLLSGHDSDLPTVRQALDELLDSSWLHFAEDKVWYCYKEDVEI